MGLAALHLSGNTILVKIPVSQVASALRSATPSLQQRKLQDSRSPYPSPRRCGIYRCGDLSGRQSPSAAFGANHTGQVCDRVGGSSTADRRCLTTYSYALLRKPRSRRGGRHLETRLLPSGSHNDRRDHDENDENETSDHTTDDASLVHHDLSKTLLHIFLHLLEPCDHRRGRGRHVDPRL
jgi:hypothetical protein